MAKAKPLPKDTWYDKKIERYCRYCSDCGISVLKFIERGNLNRSIREDSKCNDCRYPMPKDCWVDDETRKFCKECPQCGESQPYDTKSNLNEAYRNNTLCRTCYYDNKSDWLPKGTWFDEETILFYRKCPKCKTDIDYNDKMYLVRANTLKSLCFKCGNKYKTKRKPKLYKNTFSESWYKRFREQASKGKNRNHEWKLTKDDVFDEVKISEGKCFYTGVELSFGLEGEEITASIDRIDNKEGYMVGNVVICHKRINIMKGKLDVQEFADWCKLLAKEHPDTFW